VKLDLWGRGFYKVNVVVYWEDKKNWIPYW